MKNGESSQTLRIYLSSTDKFENRSLYEEIVYEAKRQNLCGATVLRGIMGFGMSSKVHSQKLWEINEKIPIVVEVVDSKEKISDFVKAITPYVEMSGKGCLMTVLESHIIFSKEGSKK
jgi:hypothetical protein